MTEPLNDNNALRLFGWETENDPVTGEVSGRYLPEPVSCRRCGSLDGFRRHGRKITRIMHTPSLGRPFPFQAHIQRYKCYDCRRTSMQPLPHVDPRHRMTIKCADYIANRCRERTFVELARDTGVDEKTVRNICFVRFGRKLHERQIRSPVMLGIDEVYLKEPGRRYKRKCSVLSDISGGSGYVDLIDGGNVNHWLWKRRDHHRIKVVLMDMCDSYRRAVVKILPDAKIVVDRFHVAKKVNEALDAVRNAKRRKDLVVAEDAGKRLPRIKRRDRNILQISRHKLSAKLWLKLDGILKNNPLFFAAWYTKESFYDIWDAKSRQEAEALFDVWKANIPPLVEKQFREVAKTVERWRQEIFAYWVIPVTNAYTESLNRMIKDMNREGRGYSFRNMRAKALLREKKLITATCDDCKMEKPMSRIKWVHLPETGPPTAQCRKCAKHFHIEDEFNDHSVSL